MRAVRRFGRFWYDFVVGDDWTMAVGVVAAITATWALARTSTAAWMAMPVVVVALLAMSLRRAQRGAATAPGARAQPRP